MTPRKWCVTMKTKLEPGVERPIDMERLLQTLRGWLEYLPIEEVKRLLQVIDHVEFVTTIVEIAKEIATVLGAGLSDVPDRRDESPDGMTES